VLKLTRETRPGLVRLGKVGLTMVNWNFPIRSRTACAASPRWWFQRQQMLNVKKKGSRHTFLLGIDIDEESHLLLSGKSSIDRHAKRIIAFRIAHAEQPMLTIQDQECAWCRGVFQVTVRESHIGRALGTDNDVRWYGETIGVEVTRDLPSSLLRERTLKPPRKSSSRRETRAMEGDPFLR